MSQPGLYSDLRFFLRRLSQPGLYSDLGLLFEKNVPAGIILFLVAPPTAIVFLRIFHS
jgi:hypothetical protein